MHGGKIARVELESDSVKASTSSDATAAQKFGAIVTENTCEKVSGHNNAQKPFEMTKTLPVQGSSAKKASFFNNFVVESVD